MACKHSAVAEKVGDKYVIEITCETHGNARTAEVPEDAVLQFLEAGFLGVMLGEVPETMFSATVSALKVAGANVGGYADLN